jgi:ubiquinone/menaquinone biosynthesis C-methylase UbiE
VNQRVTALGRRYARLATRAAVAHPRLWRLFRPLLRWNFDVLAPQWDSIRRDDTTAAVDLAFERIDPPRRVLDVGTGTGLVAALAAERFPEAEVVGVDLSPRMIEVARRNHGSERIRFEVADASALPFTDGAFDLAVLLNMIPFADELARVLEPRGRLAILFSRGAETPIWVPPKTLRPQLERAGFVDVEEHRVDSAVVLLALRV